MTTCQHCREIQDERAAIHQFDGGATRPQAEALAATERCAKHQDGVCRFECHGCGVVVLFRSSEDPTSSTGCCRDCGGDDWSMFAPDGSKMA